MERPGDSVVERRLLPQLLVSKTGDLPLPVEHRPQRLEAWRVALLESEALCLELERRFVEPAIGEDSPQEQEPPLEHVRAGKLRHVERIPKMDLQRQDKRAIGLQGRDAITIAERERRAQREESVETEQRVEPAQAFPFTEPSRAERDAGPLPHRLVELAEHFLVGLDQAGNARVSRNARHGVGSFEEVSTRGLAHVAVAVSVAADQGIERTFHGHRAVLVFRTVLIGKRGGRRQDRRRFQVAREHRLRALAVPMGAPSEEREEEPARNGPSPDPSPNPVMPHGRPIGLLTPASTDTFHSPPIRSIPFGNARLTIAAPSAHI